MPWSAARSRSRPRTAASRTSTTSRPRGSASACSRAAPGASRATGASTPRARSRPRGALPRSRSRRRSGAAARSRRSRRASGSYRTPIAIDPFDVPLADKVDLCLRAEAALRHDTVVVTQASVRAQREHKVLFSSDGVEVEQELYETGAGIDAIAANDELSQLRSYPSAHGGSSASAGWEYVEGLGLEREAPRVGEQAAALLRAEPCPAMVADAVIDSEQMALQVHESVGHPTELDRVYGTEASYAGHELPQAERPRLAPLRLGADERHRRPDDADRARHLRLRRRGRRRRAPADRRARRADRLPLVARDRGADRGRRAAATCARRAGAGCRSCG